MDLDALVRHCSKRRGVLHLDADDFFIRGVRSSGLAQIGCSVPCLSRRVTAAAAACRASRKLSAVAEAGRRSKEIQRQYGREAEMAQAVESGERQKTQPKDALTL